MTDHLITSSGPLLDAQGRLHEAGYALTPPFTYNRESIAAPAWRIKDWDYYLISDDEYAVAITVSDLGYVGLVSASVMDLASRTNRTASELVALPMGTMGLPRHSERGDLTWENRRCRVSITHHADGMRRISFAMDGFDGDEDLELEALLDEEPHDSMNICTPWAEDPTAFYYNRKIVGMRGWGGVRVGALFHEFGRQDSLALLDWGRGVWTYENTWYWSAIMGRQDGHVIALNLGYGFGDTSAASENVAFVDGVAHKLGRVEFDIPRRRDGYDYLSVWHMRDDEGRLDLRFLAEQDRADLLDVGGIVRSDQHQVFGRFSGSVTLDDGSVLELHDLRGFAEHVHNKY